jgi:hypothetical protein
MDVNMSYLGFASASVDVLEPKGWWAITFDQTWLTEVRRYFEAVQRDSET